MCARANTRQPRTWRDTLCLSARIRSWGSSTRTRPSSPLARTVTLAHSSSAAYAAHAKVLQSPTSTTVCGFVRDILVSGRFIRRRGAFVERPGVSDFNIYTLQHMLLADTRS